MSRLRIVVLVALVSLVGSVASAQQASITGVAMDESKAVLPGVNVTATDQAAGRQITAVTNEKGEYLLQNMPPGQVHAAGGARPGSRPSCSRTSSCWSARTPRSRSR